MTRFSDSDKDRDTRGVRRTAPKSTAAETGYVLGSERESYTKSPSAEGLARQRAEIGDMQGLLQRIADQVAESDRRHSDLLSELRQRITAISDRVEGARADAPGNCSAAFSRIESRMAELKSSVEAARMEARINAPAAPVPQIIRDGSPAREEASHHASGSTSAPVAALDERLMSSASPAAINSAETEAKEPWDSDSAEALARTYADFGHRELEPAPVAEAAAVEETVVATVAAEPEAVVEPAPAEASGRASSAPVQLMAASEAVALPLASVEPQPAAAVLGVDRHWLSDRFADIAQQLDRSFAKVNESEAFNDLTGRLQSIETRIEAAIAAMPLAPQDEALRGIEQQIVSLTQQVDDTMRQVSRLELVERNLSKLFGETGGIRDEVTGLASLVKGEVAGLERIVKEAVAQAPAPVAVDAQDGQPQAGQMDQIQGLIEAYVVERRESETATVGVLQQIQGAIDRLAMRLDAVEMGLPHQAVMTEAPAMRRAPMPQQAPMEMQPAMEPAAPPPVPPEQLQAGVEADYQREADVFRKPRLGQRRAPVMAPPPPEQQSEEEAAPPMEAHVEAEGKQDVISAARRAALNASQRGGEDGPLRTRAATQARSSRKSLFASEKGAPKPLLIVAAVLLLAASAGIIWGKLSDRAEPSPRMEDKVRTGELTKPAIEAEAVVTKASTKAPDEKSTGRLVELKPVEPETQPKNKISTGIVVDNSRNRPIAQEIADPEVPKAREVAPPATTKTAFEPQKSPDITLPPLTEPSNKATSELPPAQIGPVSLRSAAAKGDPSAEFEVATRFAQGKGVAKDLPKAVYWYQRAASRGFAPAQYRLGAIFERGVGVPEDIQKARLWYLRAAEQGNVKAMHNLAVLLAQSTSTSPDYTTAAHWFNAAAARGLADSQFNLAILHENGLGVAKNLPQSYKWFSLAALRGDAEAAKRRDITATHLSALEIKQAQDEIKVWRALPADPAANDPKAAGDAWKAKQETSSNDVNVNAERAEFAVKKKQAVAPQPVEAEIAEPTEPAPAETTTAPQPQTNVVRPAKRQVVKPQTPAEVEKLLTQLGYDPSKLKKAPPPKPVEPTDDNATN